MNKQTHSEETLKRTKGIIGDEDKLKSSTENPKKELKSHYIYLYLFHLYSLAEELKKLEKEHNIILINEITEVYYLINFTETYLENLAH